MNYPGRRFDDPMAEIEKKRGDKIRLLRERKALSQGDVARALRVSEKSVYNWEAGFGIRFEKKRELADLLGVAVEDLDSNAMMPNPFDLANHIDEQLEWFQDAVGRIEDRLARVETILDAFPIVQRIIEAAERLEAASPPRPRSSRATARAASAADHRP
jgi:transcriptional regulator with XRE-family HTH domain